MVKQFLARASAVEHVLAHAAQHLDREPVFEAFSHAYRDAKRFALAFLAMLG
jgi:hypothetical protein